MNPFLDLQATKVDLPVLASDPLCLSSQAALGSQVAEWFMVPDNVAPPVDWTDYDTWVSFINNQAGNGSRRIAGTGGVNSTNESITTLPRLRRKRVQVRTYSATLEVIDVTEENYALAHRFQSGNLGFRFWFRTVGGRIHGGASGIEPAFINANTPLDDGSEDYERISFLIEYHANASAPRGNVESASGSVIINGSPSVWGEDRNSIWGEDENSIWQFEN